MPTVVPAAIPATEAVHRIAAPKVAERIGPYRILSTLGEGGFGIVYLAERREPHVQRVALKVIKPGMDTRAVLARFEQERQALAVMDHPNVAKVFDAGTTDDGRPYFVMELVKGDPITDYCDRHSLSIRDRLQLFIPVCEAVQHAHHKGIIHRDLKPSNVLISVSEEKSANGGGGAAAFPKVIDFGVAKAISHTLTDKTLFTELGQIIGTPEYMSPEQAEMGATDIDTRTDVYSLGVLLYELLTGVLPFDPATLRSAGYAEIQRIIREVEPPRPSTRLTGAKAIVEELARKRQSHAEELSRQLRRELEWIPLKAMRKDRTHRYRTPTDLADDLRNYLSGRPLIAGPESQWYRLRKMAKKHRVGLGTAAAILILIIAGGGTSAWFATKEHRQRKLTALERDVALSVESFLNDDLLSAADAELDGPDVRVASILDRVSPAVKTRFANQPGVKARVLASLGRAYLGIGRPDSALPMLEESVSLLAADSTAKADLAETQILLSEAMWRNATVDGDPIKLLNDRLAQMQSDHGADDPALLRVRNELGGALKMAKRLDEAEQIYTDVLARRTRVLGPGNRDTLITQYNLALVPMERGKKLIADKKPEEATAAFRTAVKAMRECRDRAAAALGKENPVTLPMTSELASLLNRLGDAPEAIAEYEASMDAMRRVLGPRHFRTLWHIANLAVAYQKRDMTEPTLRLAQALTEEAVIAYRDEPGVAAGDTIVLTTRLAELCERLGEHSRAAWLLERAYSELTAAKASPADIKRHATSFADMFKRTNNETAAASWAERAK